MMMVRGLVSAFLCIIFSVSAFSKPTFDSISCRAQVLAKRNPLFIGITPDAALGRLRAINDRLESGEISTLKQATELGLVIISGEPVFRQGPDGSDTDQPMPFKVWHLPYAHSGLYYPTNMATFNNYNGMQLVLPGIGAQVSNARTLFDISGSFIRGADLHYRRTNPEVLRLISVPLDATVNGLAKGAPEIFGSLEGSMAVVRHAHLILRLQRKDSPFIKNEKYKWFGPDFPFFVTGRSQGGLIAIKYGTRYRDLNGVVAVNPSHSDVEIVEATHRIHILEEDPDLFNKIKVVYDETWGVYFRQTPTFDLDHGESLVNTFILYGADDPGYPHPLYDDRFAYFQSLQPDRRQIVSIPNLEKSERHNLWDRKNFPLYPRVIDIMKNFFVSQIPIATAKFYKK